MGFGRRFTEGEFNDLNKKKLEKRLDKKIAVEKKKTFKGVKKDNTFRDKKFLAYLEDMDIVKPVCTVNGGELKFHPIRKWSFDFCWPEHMVALEVEGGAWTQGRHTRGQGFINDMEKYNAAVLLGWKLLRVVPDDLDKLSTIQMLKKILQ